MYIDLIRGYGKNVQIVKIVKTLGPFKDISLNSSTAIYADGKQVLCFDRDSSFWSELPEDSSNSVQIKIRN